MCHINLSLYSIILWCKNFLNNFLQRGSAQSFDKGHAKKISSFAFDGNDGRLYFRQRSNSNSTAFCPIMSSHAYISLWNRLHFLCVLFMRCCRIFVFAAFLIPTLTHTASKALGCMHKTDMSLLCPCD